jgi:hypothetical protein
VNPYDSPETRPAGSGSSKVLWGLAIGCGVLVVLCCGGVGLSGFLFYRSMNLSQDAADVRAVTESIVTIEVPPELEPKVSMDWTIPFVNRKMMSMAIYGDDKDHSGLVLFQLDEGMGGANRDAMEAQFKQQMRQSGEGEMADVKIEEPETFKTTINGEETEFTYGQGKHEKDGREVWQASGGFAGKGGPAMLFMQLDGTSFSKEQVVGVLESMK